MKRIILFSSNVIFHFSTLKRDFVKSMTMRCCFCILQGGLLNDSFQMDGGETENLVSTDNGTLIFEVNGQTFEFISENDNLELLTENQDTVPEDQEYTIIITQDDDNQDIDDRQTIEINDTDTVDVVNTLEENVFTVQFPVKRDGHPCLVCGRVFSRKADTKRHLKTVHLDEKNWPCDICGKRFADKRDMNRHSLALHRYKRPPGPTGPSYFVSFPTKSDLMTEQNKKPKLEDEITVKMEASEEDDKITIKQEELQDSFYDLGGFVEV